jgi:hypothetical protein
MRVTSIIAGVLILSCLVAAYAFAVNRTAENALLPEGREVPIRAPKEESRPLYPDCGEILIGEGTCTVFDGYIDEEWIGATVIDVSDTCGQSDGLPNEPGSCYLYLMMDEGAIYFGVDVVADSFQDLYDGTRFYLDDNDDGCRPADLTNEGDIKLTEDFTGGFCYYRWWQDENCAGQCVDCYDYMPAYTDLGVIYDIHPVGWGSGTASGHMQYEIGIYYGAMADEDWEIQTYFDLGETCGLSMYAIDQYYYDFMGEMPCTGNSSTYIWPCSWPSLVGVKPDFTFSMEPFQTQVPIGGTLDFAKHFTNSTCQAMTIHDTIYVYKGGNPVKTFAFEWVFECEQDLDLCFALQVPEKGQFICWDITIVNSGVAVAGGDEYPFEESFDVHIEPGHTSEVPCPD